jgi:hypothetical protein
MVTSHIQEAIQVVGATGVAVANGSVTRMEDAWRDLIRDVACRRKT